MSVTPSTASLTMSGPKPAEWERHRKEIVELYLEKATLREVAEIMEARYGFKAE